jgi:putative transposase
MSKYKNKYRIESARMPHWDYGSNALYFITICTKNRFCFFGEVVQGCMQLSEIGKLAEKYWLEIPQHFPFVILHHHVVMPNHVHGIIEIAKSIDDNANDNDNANANGNDNGNGNGNDNANENGNDNAVETQNFASLPILSPIPSPIPPRNQFGAQSQNLASIVRGYKIGVTKNARFIDPIFQWQPRYHDHIIRNVESYDRISQYILNNPNKWQEDMFHPTNPNSDK